MKLLVDMNLSPRWVDKLHASQVDAVHWSTVGKASAPDSEIMTFAAKNGYVVLTQDLDFSTILAATAEQKPSVIQVRSAEVSPEAIGHQVISAIFQMAAELESGALLTIDPKQTRLRLLPFPSKA